MVLVRGGPSGVPWLTTDIRAGLYADNSLYNQLYSSKNFDSSIKQGSTHTRDTHTDIHTQTTKVRQRINNAHTVHYCNWHFDSLSLCFVLYDWGVLDDCSLYGRKQTVYSAVLSMDSNRYSFAGRLRDVLRLANYATIDWLLWHVFLRSSFFWYFLLFCFLLGLLFYLITANNDNLIEDIIHITNVNGISF